MSRKENSRLNEIENLVENGNYKEASKILSTVKIEDLSEDEKKKIKVFCSIIKPDFTYIIVSIAVILMGITYFLIVK